MSYLLKRDEQNLYLISMISDNLFYKVIPSRYNRSTTLSRNVTDIYTASLDQQKNVHVIFKNREHKIIHLKQSDHRFVRSVILDDASNTYNISNMQLIINQEEMYLFYTANNPYENTYDLIFHQLNQPNASPQSLLSLPHLNASYEVVTIGKTLYLICYNKSENYTLSLYHYNPDNNEWQVSKNLHTQNNPITYATLCTDEKSNLHCLFISEQFGRYELYYINTLQLQPKRIHTAPCSLEPIIFKYKQFLWLNWLEGKRNKMVFSTDDGTSFSPITNASLQSDQLELLHLINPYDTLYGKRFYGSVSGTPRISVLSQIDLENSLLQHNTNRELNLLFEELQSNKPTTSQSSDLEEEVAYLKPVQESITNQYNNLAKLAKELQEEGKKWKNKYMKSEVEIKKLKEKLNAHKKQINTSSVSASTTANETIASTSIKENEIDSLYENETE